MTHPEHHRVTWVVIQKSDDHFVTDFRPKIRAPLLARVERDEACPDAVLAAADQRHADLDPVFPRRVVLQRRNDADLQPADGRQQAGRREGTEIVGFGKAFGAQTELDVGFPVAAGQAMANAGNVHFTSKPRANPGDLDDPARRDSGETLKCGAATHFRQTLTQQPGIGPRLQFGLAEFAAVPEFQRVAAGHGGQVGGREIAAVHRLRLFRVGADYDLVAGIPAARGNAFALPSGVDFRVQFEYRRAISNLEHGRGCRQRFADTDLVIFHQHDLAIRLGPTEQEIPVAGVILNHFLQVGEGRLDGFLQPVKADHFLHDIAVLLVDKITAPGPAGHPHRLMPAFDSQNIATLAYPDRLFDDDSLEYRFVVRAIPQLDFNSFPRHEAVRIADRERPLGRIAILYLQRCGRNPVQFAADRKRQDVKFTADLLPLNQDRQRADIRRRRRGNGGFVAHLNASPFPAVERSGHCPA